MENLLPFIIMLILGALFNSGKKKAPKDNGQQTKPFTAGETEQDNPIKKLKEMSRDLYKEIQQEFEAEADPEPVPTPRPVRKRREIAVEVKDLEPIPEPRVKSRVALTESRQRNEKSTVKKRQTTQKQLVPTTSDDIMRGVIFSEIIGPPKSKR